MQLLNCTAVLSGRNAVRISIGVILLSVIITNFHHARYNQQDGVIEWDVKSYYAWLPATFIYNDLSLEFRRDNIEKFGELIWPVETPKGKQAIVTTMGMSILYSPFFFAAHMFSLSTSFEADGYSRPYRFAITFGALFYLLAGLIFLKRILKRYFGEYIIAATLVIVVLGTNLFYYSTYEAAMTHVYNFSLIAGFLWLTIRFYENPSVLKIVAGGLLSGLITLIRPVNIIVLVLFFLWDIKSFNGFKSRFRFFAGKYTWLLLMALSFLLIWVPQFIYWHWVSGKLFYFSYGELGGRFFFSNPQVMNILFSIKKGWLVYTPVMFFALAGIFVLLKKLPGTVLPFSVFMVLNVYVLSSWWNWWYGGGFGLRSFVGSYALLAIPLAAFLEFISTRRGVIRYPAIGLIAMLVFYNLFQTRQYVNNAIHWWWMNREAYMETFLRLHPTEKFWNLVTLPDHDLARQGIYREIRPGTAEMTEKTDWRRTPAEGELVVWIANKLEKEEGLIDSLYAVPSYQGMDTQEMLRAEASVRLEEKGREYYERMWALELIVKEMEGSPQMINYIREKAEKNNISYDSMLLIDAAWLYENQRK
ncbi:MAG: hypothetical protein R6U58_06535 [Bacteroidales bacterium]